MSYIEPNDSKSAKAATEHNKRIEAAEKKYADHFGSFPERIIGWWDPLVLPSDTKYWDKCVADMEKDVEQAIASDTPFEQIPKDIWEQIIF